MDDVAGIRVICPFISDIYTIANLITSQDDITVLKIKDYIKAPKSNGYRSYHMIVEIPVFFTEGKVPMRAEIQIRTIGMDFWASVDHQLRYKKTIGADKDIEDHRSRTFEMCTNRKRDGLPHGRDQRHDRTTLEKILTGIKLNIQKEEGVPFIRNPSSFICTCFILSL